MAEPGSTTRRGVLRVAGRASWALLDQGVSSFTNFALGILIARSVSATEFGAFSLAFATYLIVLNLARAVGTQPLVIRYSERNEHDWRRGSARATGSMLAYGVIGGILSIGAGMLLGGTTGATFIALGLFLPALLLQDSWRFTFFAAGRDRDALLTDACWAGSLVLLLVGISQVASAVPAFVIGWGVSAVLGSIVGIWRSGVRPSPLRVRSWLQEQSDLAGRFTAEVIVSQVATQAAIYVVGFVGGLAAAGSIRAAQILLGPMHVILQASFLLAVPEGVRIRQRHPTRFPLSMAALGAGLTGIIVLWVSILLLAPTDIGSALLGDSWADAQLVLLPLGVALAAEGAATAPVIGMRVLADAVSGLRSRVIDSGVGFILAVGGALVAGAVGAAWGFAAAASIAVIVNWGFFVRSERRHRLVSLG